MPLHDTDQEVDVSQIKKNERHVERRENLRYAAQSVPKSIFYLIIAGCLFALLGWLETLD